MEEIVGATSGEDSGQILSRHALLGPCRQEAGLLHDSLGRFIETVAVAVRAIHHTLGDDGIAAFANLEVVGSGDDFFSARRTVGEMGVIGGHERNLSAPEDVEKGVDRLVHRLARGLGDGLQDRLHSFQGRPTCSGDKARGEVFRRRIE